MTTVPDPDPRPALTDAQLDEIEARARGAPNWVRVDVFSLLGEARRARAEVRHLLAVLADADWRLENCSEAERDALRDHAARLEEALAHYADQSTWEPAVLRPGWPVLHRRYRHGGYDHGYEVARAALLDPPTTTGRAGESAPTHCEDSGVALDDPRDG